MNWNLISLLPTYVPERREDHKTSILPKNTAQ